MLNGPGIHVKGPFHSFSGREQASWSQAEQKGGGCDVVPCLGGGGGGEGVEAGGVGVGHFRMPLFRLQGRGAPDVYEAERLVSESHCPVL